MSELTPHSAADAEDTNPGVVAGVLPPTHELLRRAESVRNTLAVAGLVLVFALTLTVQMQRAQRAHHRATIADRATSVHDAGTSGTAGHTTGKEPGNPVVNTGNGAALSPAGVRGVSR